MFRIRLTINVWMRMIAGVEILFENIKILMMMLSFR